jgi:uncharacterized protein YndB with AHSA1/START domain
MKPKGLQISTPTDTTIVLTRTFNAPRRLVWEAMFTPDKMRRWMLPPPGWTMTVCEVEARMGGVLKLAWKNEEADPFMTLEGVFTEVNPHERIVHTETMATGSGQTIAVVEAILDSIALTPSSLPVALGHVQPFRADATYLDADARPFHLDLTTQAGWLSSDKSVARIDNAPRTSGLASTLFSGTTTISGAFTGVGNTTTLTVASQSSQPARERRAAK